MTAQEQKAPKGEERYLLVELSCRDRKCSPCTYPNCQRFVRTLPKKKPFETRMTKMFEIKKSIAKPQDTRERVVLIELSCKDEKCSPCTYPNCQRFARETLKKKVPFKVKVTEIEKGKEVQSLLAK
ncbi:MAG TPA: hypothetical protein VJ489_03795 [Thermoplasmata archaeon]|nr:hypothetical protein [Thermoplasmata archaeon]